LNGNVLEGDKKKDGKGAMKKGQEAYSKGAEMKNGYTKLYEPRAKEGGEKRVVAL